MIGNGKEKICLLSGRRVWIGWLEELPDYRTQGETLEELEENLKDIYEELTSGRIPCVHHVGELVVG